jgi:hypothetical protein
MDLVQPPGGAREGSSQLGSLRENPPRALCGQAEEAPNLKLHVQRTPFQGKVGHFTDIAAMNMPGRLLASWAARLRGRKSDKDRHGAGIDLLQRQIA